MAEKPQQRKPPRRKKAWQRPRVKTGQLFESNSLACLKNDIGMEQCADQGFTTS